MQYDISADPSTGIPATLTVACALGEGSYAHYLNALGLPVRIRVVWHSAYAAPAPNGSVGVCGCESASKPPPPPPA